MDLFSLLGAIAGIALLPGNNPVGKLAVGAAVGTAGYIAIMPFLPHYDSKDWIKDIPTDPQVEGKKKDE